MTRWYGENRVCLGFRRSFFPILTRWYGEKRVFFISPFVLPRSPMKATISRLSAYFVAFCIPSRLWKQLFPEFSPILLPTAFRLAYGSNYFPVFNLFCCLLRSVSPAEATISQFSAYFVAFCIPSRLRKQQFPEFSPILLPSTFYFRLRKQQFHSFQPILLPSTFYFHLRKQQFPKFLPILLLSTSSEKTVVYEL